MSSILRALKKLENDPRHLEENPSLDSKFVPLADTSAKKTAPVLLMMVLGGSIVCGLVVLAGWQLFSTKTQAPPAVPQKIVSQRLQQTELAPVRPEEPGPPDASAVSLEPAKPAADVVTPQEAADLLPEPTAAIIPQPSSPAIAPAALTPAAGQGAESSIQATAAPSLEIIEQVPAGSRTPAAAIKVEEAQIPLLNDPDMKLQAITWSKDPQKRIAVINNRIMRQGDMVYGYRLDTINQDDVILSDAGEKWQLSFRIK